jgi:ABC-type Na+ efflux pump permease subunit
LKTAIHLRKLLTEKLILMLNFEKDTKKSYIILSLLFIILLIIINITQFTFTKSSFDNSKFIKNEVKEIKSDIEKYEKDNKKLSEKIATYEKMLIKIDSNIATNNQKIDILKNNTNEKINSFKSYDARMWEKFFTDRYKK